MSRLAVIVAMAVLVLHVWTSTEGKPQRAGFAKNRQTLAEKAQRSANDDGLHDLRSIFDIGRIWGQSQGEAKPKKRSMGGCDTWMVACGNGDCVPTYWRCNGQQDCGDFTDEIGCGSCSAGEFYCSDDSGCVNEDLLCDGVNDCSDGSDEHSAACRQRCYVDQYKCPDGGCIPIEAACDGRDDCEGGADEVMCPGECSEGYLQCQSGLCIPESELCNGVVNCESDALDERFC